MPELPEVETVARQLAPRLRGRRLRRVVILDSRRLGRPDVDAVQGRRIDRVRRVGKQVALEFRARRGEASPPRLCVHLGMTGRLSWTAAAGTDPPHLRARLEFAGGELLFTDVRRFGRLSIFRRREDGDPAGLEPLSAAFTVRALAQLLRGSRQPIKPWLLRQDRLVGIGNIYAAEILHCAGIDPFAAAGALEPDAVRRLCRAVRRVLRQAVACRGTTLSDYRDAEGKSGGYGCRLAVYGRQGEPCAACGTPIRRAVQAQRGTWWCPRCQGGSP